MESSNEDDDAKGGRDEEEAETVAERTINVASAAAGARILFCTDEWFAAADRLLQDTEPQFDPDAYCAQGKVMDGWESRRRREPGHDWCILQLSQRASLRAVQIDTAYFTGNQAPAVSLLATDLDEATADDWISTLPRAIRRLRTPPNDLDRFRGTGATPEEVDRAETAGRTLAWQEILPQQALQPGYEATRHHVFALQGGVVATHVRVNYFPDGGVARLRLYGVPVIDETSLLPSSLYMPIITGPSCTVVSYDDADAIMPSEEDTVDEASEVSCLDAGGDGLWASNAHYGRPANLLQRHRGVDMGDGWETARQPQRPGVLVRQPLSGLVDFGSLSESCVLRLGHMVHSVRRIIIDTQHFKGNYPESVELHGCSLPLHDNDRVDWEDSVIAWFPLIPRIRLSPHAEHCFDDGAGQIVAAPTPVSHVRVRIFPDGGLSRVRIYGSSNADSPK